MGTSPTLAKRERPQRSSRCHPPENLSGPRPAAGRHRRSGNGVHQEHHPGRRARRTHRLAGSSKRAQRPTSTPELGRDNEPERTKLTQHMHIFCREGTLAIDASCIPGDPLLSGLTNRLQQDLNIVAHGENPFGR
jgi:hypothetical protein